MIKVSKRDFLLIPLILVIFLTLACVHTSIKEEDTEKTYKSEKGIEFIIPKKWNGIVEINEDSSYINFDYIGIPDKKISVFKIKIWPKETYFKYLPETTYNYIIGENKNYVFQLINPIDIDISLQEANKITDYQSTIIPVQEIEKELKLNNETCQRPCQRTGLNPE